MSDPAHTSGNLRMPARPEPVPAPTQDPNGWTKLFHPRGPQCTLPLPCDPAAALAHVSAALDAGWLVQAPGLEEGEGKETVGWVLQGTHERDGECVPFVLLYAANDQMTWSFLKVYLNRPADVEAFERASRMQLAKIKPYVGNDKPQRGASKKTDTFIVAAPRPFEVVFKKNPKHDPNTEEGKMKPARLFVRWADLPANTPPAAPGNGQLPPADESQLTHLSEEQMRDWKAHIGCMQAPREWLEARTELLGIANPWRTELKKLLAARMREGGYEWDGKRGALVALANADPF